MTTAASGRRTLEHGGGHAQIQPLHRALLIFELTAEVHEIAGWHIDLAIDGGPQVLDHDSYLARTRLWAACGTSMVDIEDGACTDYRIF